MDWERIPLFLYLVAVGALAMLPVALLAATDGDFLTAQPFFYGAVLIFIVTVMVALTLHNRKSVLAAREHLLALLGAFTVLPLILAWPLIETAPGLRLIDGYLEMASAVTTTGLTVQEMPQAWPRALHLWRAEVAWLGGLLIWVSAIAILAPLRIGGFELVLPRTQDPLRRVQWLGQRVISPKQRIYRAFVSLSGVYIGLTFLAWLALMVVGEAPFIALIHAMSMLATSGISPVGGLSQGDAGLLGEIVVFGFFIFAITRRSFSRDMPALRQGPIWKEPELLVAVGAVLLVTITLFVRHWYALVETAEVVGPGLITRAVWGAIFTSASFLTTTGFVSEHWEIARLWSGLSTPGMVLMGLALIGGGVATTAGGVKLLRIYVLYKHGQYEVSRLIHPSTVGGIGGRGARIGRDSAFMAWLFFMLIALSITLMMMAFAFFGVGFETATVLTLAGISNTGQLLDVAMVLPIRPIELSDPAKLVLVVAMTLGRLETLAIISLFNPDFWRG